MQRTGQDGSGGVNRNRKGEDDQRQHRFVAQQTAQFFNAEGYKYYVIRALPLLFFQQQNAQTHHHRDGNQ
ncbi:Uncharacterised protein [Salmonella enterica subsp. enterica]|uniref:Uncharacterized protein n=1 Tax=Salmonella enterica I TaxID=59201 RepID=A0A379VI32_SALET|nr:Uncharacterised protein [Salmonella enterica subsp. enterica]